MYEHITYDLVMQRMLDEVPDDVDKREGSIIWNALAPAAIEVCNMYAEIDYTYDQTFADTAEDEYLIRRCAERGITPDPATHAIFKGEFNMDVPIESRFSLEDFNYVVREKISEGIYKLECEAEGVGSNSFLGPLIPVEYIDGLTIARLTELLVPGEDGDDNESLRRKYFNSFNSQAFGGNAADYKEKTNKLPGVGGVKVYRAWNGGGTVKLVIINSDYHKPSATLIADVQTGIDPLENQGEGVGIAPIGHVVTVDGVLEAILNIATDVTLQDGWTWDDVESSFFSVIDDYFSELAETWAKSDNLVVRISQIETRLLNVTGVVDIMNTTINGAQQNIILDADSIPVRGGVNGQRN
ncbi:baseplate J/gp47 family protein [Peribacillus loiseleuriae]|uniref:Phage tail protein n=1 Tax=Peribacillus loiseleuriae TaxID=1679170 RepID=A0A0K9GSI7_9BACI|nr:baseplate J/gp47 family protein [Peribacillus loiseleuriae]KMY49242.1 phage tail protein [Peribacillus loiseleuriae]